MSRQTVDYMAKVVLPDLYARLTALEIRIKALEEVKQKNE